MPACCEGTGVEPVAGTAVEAKASATVEPEASVETAALGTISREEWRTALYEKFGRELSERLEGAQVAICGAGGLGSNVAISLARAGVGSLQLFDFDTVDLSNLNRQQYAVSQLGQPKVLALAHNLAQIAPFCRIQAYELRISPELIPGLFDGADVICECFDNPEQKALLVQGVRESYPETPLVAASGMAGMGSANQVVTRKVGRNFYLCGDGASDVADGLPLAAPRVLACAAHEAHMVLRLLAGYDAVLG